MANQFLCSFLALLLYTSPNLHTPVTTEAGSEQICGRWMTEEKNLIVNVYKDEDEYKAKIVWFRADKEKPMEAWYDENNPNPSLRTRKIVGLDVLHQLTYSQDTQSWENGIIYDAKNGKEWNAAARIDKNGMLNVKGYWHFKFIGKTMRFTRI